MTLERDGIRLEPLTLDHQDELVSAVSDGKLWELWFTAVPKPEQVRTWVTAALAGQEAGHMLPWAVRELTSGKIIGSTRYHDIVPAIDRVEVGYTFYAKSWQTQPRQHDLQVTGVRPRIRNPRLPGGRFAHRQLQFRVPARDRERWARRKTASFATIRRAATAPRATRTCSASSLSEWPDVKRHLELRLARHAT